MILTPRHRSNPWFYSLLTMLFVTSLMVGAYPVRSAPGDSIASNPGDLDPTFGSGGLVISSVGSGESYGQAAVLQPDGKILVVGAASNGSDRDIALMRYHRSGDLDATFGGAGIVTTPVGPANDFGIDVALQPDGKILVAGDVHYGSGNYDFALLRYTVSGELDTTFGSNGIVTTPIGSGRDQVSALVIQPDGKIIVVGFTNNGVDSDIALVRYTLSGVLDTTFGNSGVLTTAIGTGHDSANGVTLQPDGKILVAGRANNGSNDDIALLRYTPSGDLDPAFGSSGVVTTPIGTSTDIARSISLQPDGKILVAGYTYANSQSDFALVRYNDSGDLDTTFGSGGIVTTFISAGHDRANSIALQSDGKIVIAGEANNGSDTDFVLVRYSTSGDLDTSFGSGGIVTTHINSTNIVEDLAVQSDGKLIAVGYVSNGSRYDIALARYYAYRTHPIYLPHVVR